MLNFNTNCILTVGPEYKNHRGGIGAVIEGYSKEFKPFHFITTHKPLNKYIIPFYSILSLIYFPLYLLLNQNIRIVHIHGASRGSFLRKYFVFIVARYFFQKKIIYHVHGSEYHLFYEKSNRILKNLIEHLINNTEAVICLSRSWERFFLSNFKPKKIEVIPNVVEPSSFIHKDIGSKGKIVFLFLGRIGERKGIYDVIDVSQELKKTFAGLFEIWVGGDGDIKKLSNLIKEKKLEETIKYYGWVSGVNKINLLKRASVFLLPSYNEGLPVSILEAMAYGMPVISTNVGGIPELVQDGKSGFLFDAGDKKALKVSMEAFLRDQNLVTEMGRKSFAIIEEGYTMQIALKKLDDLYLEILED